MIEFNRIKPSIGRVAVELIRQEERTKSGLYLPQQAQEVAANCGIVVAVCDDYTDSDGQTGPLYKLGEVVVFGKYTGSKLEVNDKKYVVLREDDILCTLHMEETDAGSAGSATGVIPIDGVRPAPRVPFLASDTNPTGSATVE